MSLGLLHGAKRSARRVAVVLGKIAAVVVFGVVVAVGMALLSGVERPIAVATYIAPFTAAAALVYFTVIWIVGLFGYRVTSDWLGYSTTLEKVDERSTSSDREPERSPRSSRANGTQLGDEQQLPDPERKILRDIERSDAPERAKDVLREAIQSGTYDLSDPESRDFLCVRLQSADFSDVAEKVQRGRYDGE